ncbi:GNAT family N-acetyltransferase [Arenibaculum pallidiluteum]|uniref:GNAT family N-acetyltransferase n=1 Tax=Arenibaculum pallidiluteum TaxID=2812559 RepID=UPI001A97CA69|nr:GNAT family N-acetyltransferase [Arenibaculum pallidiluteum]
MHVFRKLLPAERSKLRDHLLRLSAPDRLLRFSGTIGDASVAAYCDSLDWGSGHVVGVFVDGVLRGVADLRLESGFLPSWGEIALSVETPWQKQGVGTELMRYALVVARNRGVRKVLCICRPENLPMQRLARKFGATLRREEDEVIADIPVPVGTYLTLCAEAATEGLGLVGAWFDGLTPRPQAA